MPACPLLLPVFAARCLPASTRDRIAGVGGAHAAYQGGGMDIGFGAAVAGAWATPRNLAELGAAGGAARLPVAVDVPAAARARPGANLAPVYQSVLDPMVSLGYLAAATSSIRLGVAVVNHPFASPLLLAKQAATVDVLSGGRLDLGIGSGWLAEEFTGSGASMAQRGARADEYVAALRALWTGAGGYQGTFFTIPAGAAGPGARAAAGAADPDRRHVTGGDGAGRADRRRVGDRVERGPVHDRRVGQGGAERRAGGRARPGADRLPRRGPAGQAVGLQDDRASGGCFPGRTSRSARTSGGWEAAGSPRCSMT